MRRLSSRVRLEQTRLQPTCSCASSVPVPSLAARCAPASRLRQAFGNPDPWEPSAAGVQLPGCGFQYTPSDPLQRGRDASDAPAGPVRRMLSIVSHVSPWGMQRYQQSWVPSNSCRHAMNPTVQRTCALNKRLEWNNAVSDSHTICDLPQGMERACASVSRPGGLSRVTCQRRSRCRRVHSAQCGSVLRQ